MESSERHVLYWKMYKPSTECITNLHVPNYIVLKYMTETQVFSPFNSCGIRMCHDHVFWWLLAGQHSLPMQPQTDLCFSQLMDSCKPCISVSKLCKDYVGRHIVWDLRWHFLVTFIKQQYWWTPRKVTTVNTFKDNLSQSFPCTTRRWYVQKNRDIGGSNSKTNLESSGSERKQVLEYLSPHSLLIFSFLYTVEKYIIKLFIGLK